MKSNHIAYLLAVLLCGISVGSASGDTTYSYTGSTFTTVVGSPPSGIGSDFITAMLTFASPLAPNLSLDTVTPVSWSISDQIDRLNSADPTASIVQSIFSTDATGKIVATTMFSMAAIFGNLEIEMETFNPGGDAVRVSAISGPGAGLIYQASTTHTGTYALSPEPGTTALGLLGSLVVILAVRRRWGATGILRNS